MTRPDRGIRRRITNAMILLTLGVSAIIGGLSFFSIHYLIRENVRLSKESEARQMAQKLEHAFLSIQQDLSGLSGNSIILNSIIDTEGSRIYIDPFLRSYRPMGDIDIRLTICDYLGNPIATNAGKPAPYNSQDILMATIGQGLPYASALPAAGNDNTQRILLAFPVVWSMTKKGEGILVAEFVLGEFVDRTLYNVGENADHGLVVRSGSRVLLAKSSRTRKGTVELRKRLALGDPLGALNLSVDIENYRQLDLWWLFPMYAAAIVGLLAVCVLPARRISSALTVQLRSLTGVARDVAESGNLELKAEVSGPEEVRVLASSFNGMIEKVKRSRDFLETRVSERTAELERANRELSSSNAEKERLIGELREALASIRTLRGLLPICSSCKKIRDDKGYWNQIELYISLHSEVDFSHGLCPECAERIFGDYLKHRE